MKSSPLRRTLVSSLLALGLGWPGLPCDAAPAAARPSIIIVLTDDQGYGDLSAHGNPVLRTPNLDRLHGESIRLTDFHVAPMCTPTRGQLMTGVDALRNGAMSVSSGRATVRRDFPMMPELLAAHGYRTGIFGKWHIGNNHPYRPQDRGFQESIWFPSSHIPSAAGYFNNDCFDDVYHHNGVAQKFEGYTTDVFFREARSWMRRQAERQEPFLCYLPLAAAHGPHFVPDRYRESYRDQGPATASFYGMLANLDENIGQLDVFLRQTGLRENTILIFLSDNGAPPNIPGFNAGLRGRKTELYEGGHRVPFFIRWPAGGLRAAGDIDALTQAQDVLPTLLELCGVPKPAGAKFDGMSLAGLLRGQARALPDRKLVIQFGRAHDSQPRKGNGVVLWKRWRLVADKELYDLATDPGQARSVSAQFPEVVAELREHYAGWWADIEPRVHEISPIHLGAKAENPSLLTPCDWIDVHFDQQRQVRTAKKNGAWAVFVERDGDYEFSLRRWPVEADAPLTAAMPAYQGVDGTYAAGDAFPVASAELKIGDQRQTKPVARADKAANFTVALERGRTELQTWFRDAAGQEIAGAYYVYVRALRP